jgi:hypothetical protein
LLRTCAASNPLAFPGLPANAVSPNSTGLKKDAVPTMRISSNRSGRLAMALWLSLLLALAACSAPRPPATPTPTPAPLPTATPTPVKTVDQVTAALPTSKFLDSMHVVKGIECVLCHGTMPPTGAPATEVCLGCHGGSYTVLGDKTTTVTPNPHRSHNGALACTECHHSHAPFTFYCGSCHNEFRNERYQ